MIATLTTLKVVWMLVSLSAFVGFGLCIGCCFATACGFRPTFNVRVKTRLAAEAQRPGEDDDACREVPRSQEDVQP